MVIIRIRIRSKEGQGDTLAAVVVKESPKVREQAGCEAFELFRSAKDENAFLLYEEWQDRASFKAYKKSESFESLGSALGPLLAGAPDSVYYEGKTFTDG